MFSTGGKDLNALKHELARLESFWNAETSTLSATKAYKKSIEEQFMRITGASNASLRTIREFWEAIHKIEDLRKDIFQYKNYAAALNDLFNQGVAFEKWESMNMDERINYLIQAIEQKQQEQMQTIQDMFPVTDPFEL